MDPEQNWQRTAFQPLPDLQQILGSIPWALVGAIGRRAYTAERMTETVDVLVNARDADAARTALQDRAIQLVPRDDAWVDETLCHPTSDGAGYPVLKRAYLILLHLEASHGQDFGDVVSLLATAPAEERTAIQRLLEALLPAALEDYDGLCELADREFGHP